MKDLYAGLFCISNAIQRSERFYVGKEKGEILNALDTLLDEWGEAPLRKVRKERYGIK